MTSLPPDHTPAAGQPVVCVKTKTVLPKLTIGLVLTLLAAAVAFGVWKGSVVTHAEAKDTHEVIHKRITKVDEKADSAVKQMQTVGRDVRTIKCILTAPTRKDKANCGLED